MPSSNKMYREPNLDDYRNNPRISAMLLNSGVNPNTYINGLAVSPYLYNAVVRSDATRVKLLLDNGANANTPYALSLAALNENEEIAELLIWAGAGTGTATMNASSLSVLHNIVREGKLKLFNMLVATGADINGRFGGRTPLEVAMSAKQIDAVRLILGAGASPIVDEYVARTFVEFLKKDGAEARAEARARDDADLLDKLYIRSDQTLREYIATSLLTPSKKSRYA